MRNVLAKAIILASCIFTLLLSILFPVAPGVASADSGLSIIGAFVEDIIEPGNTYSYTTTIESSAGAPAMDILVDASGFGNDLQGAWVHIDAGNDSSPYSALAYIKGLSPTYFHLDPGGSQEVSWNMEIPAVVGNGTRYAMLHIHTLPVGEGDMGYILAADIPMILEVNGSTKTLTGEITDLAVVNMSSGNPIDVSTVLRNTGNSHYKARNEVKMTNENGELVATAYTLLSGESIIPTYSRQFDGSLVLTGQKNELPLGNYSIESKVMLLDGTVLDTETISLTVEETYKYPTGGSSSLCPGVDASGVSIRVFANEVPSCIDFSAEAGIKICFSDTGTVTGRVAVGRYTTGVPPIPVFYHAPVNEGGTGKTAVKFVSVDVQGFDDGDAQITVFYTNDEVRGLDEENLILAYWDGIEWRTLKPVNIQPSSNTITGSIPVTALAGGCTAIGLGGSIDGTAAEQGYPLWLFCIIPIVGCVGLIAYLSWRKKRRKGIHNKPVKDKKKR